MNKWLSLARAKLKLERRILTSVLGLGLTGVLGSAGTFALFTASSSNPNNVFTAGSLLLTDTTSFATAATTLGPGLGHGAPNQTGTDPRALTECGTPIVAAQCSTLLKSVNVAAPGMEPGQYLQGTISITNGGTLPAVLMMQIQNVKTNNGNGSLYGANGAAGSSACPSDVAGVVAPATTGPQLTANTTVPGYLGTPVAVTGCVDLGKALRITIQDAGAGGTGPQCLFGNDRNGGANGNSNLQAPVPGGFGSGGGGITTFTASGSELGTGSGACDDLTQAALLGQSSAPVLPGSNPKDLFGTEASPAGNSSLAGLSSTATLVFIPGGGTSHSVVSQANLGGNLGNLPQWNAGETHAFTMTLALPDSGSTLITDANRDKYRISNDSPFQGGAVSFDLYWFAIQ